MKAVGLLCFVLISVAYASSGATTSCTQPLFSSGTSCNRPGTGTSSTYQIAQVFSNMPCGDVSAPETDCILQTGIQSIFGTNVSCSTQQLMDFTGLCAGNKNTNGIAFNINIDRGCDFNFTFSTVSADQTQQGCQPQEPFCYPSGSCPIDQECAILDPVVNITVSISSLTWTRNILSVAQNMVQFPFEYWSFERDLNYYRQPNQESYCCTKDTPISTYAEETMSCFQNCGSETCNFLSVNSEVGGNAENAYCCFNNFHPASGQSNVNNPSLNQFNYDAFSWSGATLYKMSMFLSNGFVMANMSAYPNQVWADSVHPWDLLKQYMSATTSAFSGPIPVAPGIVSNTGNANEAMIPQYQFYTPAVSSFCGNIITQLNQKLPQGQGGDVFDVFTLFYNSMFNITDCDIEVPPSLVQDAKGSSIRGGYWMPIFSTVYNSATEYVTVSNAPNQYALQCSFCGTTPSYCVCTDGTNDCPGNYTNEPIMSCMEVANNNAIQWSLQGMVCQQGTAHVKCNGQCYNGENREGDGTCADGQAGASNICGGCLGGKCDNFQTPANDLCMPGGFTQRFWLNGMAPQCYVAAIGDKVSAVPTFDVTVTVSQIFGTGNTVPIVSTVHLTNVTTVSDFGGCGEFNTFATGDSPNLYVGITPSKTYGSVSDPMGDTNGYIGFCVSNPSNPNACQWNACSQLANAPPGCGEFNIGQGYSYSNTNLWAPQKNEFLPPNQPLGCKCCMPIQQPLSDYTFRHWWYWDQNDYSNYVYDTASTSQELGCGTLGMQPNTLWGNADQYQGHDTVVGSWEKHNAIGLQAQICSSWKPGVPPYNPLNGFVNSTNPAAAEGYGGFAGLCRPKTTPCSIAADYAYYEAYVQRYYANSQHSITDTCPVLSQPLSGLWSQYTPDVPNMQIAIEAPDDGQSGNCNSQCTGTDKVLSSYRFPEYVSYSSGLPVDVDPPTYGFNLFIVIGSEITASSEIVGLLYIPEGEDNTYPCSLTSYSQTGQPQTNFDIGTVNFFTAVSSNTNYNFGGVVNTNGQITPPILYDGGTLSAKGDIGCCLSLDGKYCSNQNIQLGGQVFNQTFHVLCNRTAQQAIDCNSNGNGAYEEGEASNPGTTYNKAATVFTLRSCNKQISDMGSTPPCSDPGTYPPSTTATPVPTAGPPPPNSPPPPLGPTSPPSTPSPQPTAYNITTSPTPSLLSPVPTDNAHSTTFWIEIGAIILIVITVLTVFCIFFYCACKGKL